MKQLLLIITIVGILVTCEKSPVTGTGDDVSTGSIFGMLLTDNKPIVDTVSVSLYSEGPTGGVSKVRSGSITPVQTLTAHDGSYSFDSLPSGTYRIVVTKDEIVIGENQSITLGRNEHKMVNITIVVIINQTFNILTEQNQTIRNITVDNGKIVKTDSGYVLIFAETDTLLFQIELKEGTDTSIVQVRTIRHKDGTVAFEIVGKTSDVVVTPGTEKICVPSISIDTSASDVANGDTICGDTVRIVLANNDIALRTRFRWKADTASWSAWDGNGDTNFSITLVNIASGRHTVGIEASCTAGGDTADTAIVFFVAKKPAVSAMSDRAIRKAVGETCTLWIAAEGTGALTCTWYKDGTRIDSTNNDTLIRSSLALQDAGKYVCRVASRWGETVSDTVTLKVIKQYSVTYNGNGHTGGTVPLDNNRYETGAEATVFGNNGNLVKRGYSFTGWNGVADGSGVNYAPGSVVTIDSADVALYAKWAPESLAVTFDSRGGNAVSGQTVLYGGKVISPAVPVKSGYVFTGWFQDSSGTRVWVFTQDTVTVALTLYAKWTTGPTYTVTYNVNGGTGVAPADVNNYETGTVVTVLGNTGPLTRSGYTFAGWNTTADGSGVGYQPGVTFTIGSVNVTLYAVWSVAVYTVTFDSRGGSTVASQTVVFGGKASAPATPVRSGYTFTGWFRDAAATQMWNFAVDTVTTVLTLYAGWNAIPSYAVTYDGNGSTGGAVPIDANSYEAGTAVTVLGNTGSLTRSGYNFTGWNTAADGGGTSRPAQSTFAMGTANVTLYAQWTAAGTQFTVVYNGNGNTGGTPPSPTTHESGLPVVVMTPGSSFARTGYSFTGWNTAADGSGTGYTAGSSFTIGNANIVLYAQWQINSYSVTYNANSSISGTVPASQTLTFGTIVTVAGQGDLSRPGYWFLGWNTAANGSGTNYTAGATFDLPASDVTLYANWQLIQFTVTFNTKGGSAVAPQTVLQGGTATQPPAPTRTGADFGGWFIDAACVTAWNFATVVTADTTLFAKWSIETYRLTYSLTSSYPGPQTGTPVPSAYYEYGAVVTVAGKNTLNKPGFTFLCWTTAYGASGTDYAVGSTFSMGAADMTLFPKWDPAMHTVSFNGNGNTSGSPPAAVQVGSYYSTTLPGVGTLQRSGWIFVGWNTAADGNGKRSTAGASFSIDTTDVTLYAQWLAPQGGMKLINAQNQTFQMGHSQQDPAVHSVTLTASYWMDSTEITQQQYGTLMDVTYPDFYDPASWTSANGLGGTCPAYAINWYAAALYCNARTKITGSLDTVYRYTARSKVTYGYNLTSLVIDLSRSGYRLPTEAQWEFACRGGTSTTYYFDTLLIGNYAWYSGNDNAMSHPVAQKLPNAYGLYDMNGNVWEWCNDWFAQPYSSAAQTDPSGPASGTDRVVRGGGFEPSFTSYYYAYSSPCRLWNSPFIAMDGFGFRTVKPQ